MTSVAEQAPHPLAAAPSASSRLLSIVLPLALGGIALALRLIGLNWDNGGLYHPDERFILMTVEGRIRLPWPIDLAVLLDPALSPLNPRFFAYGSFPLYLLKAVAHGASSLQPTFATSDLRLVARALSALFDTGTVLLTYFVGLKLSGRLLGAIAAALVAFAALHIQLAHFYAVDTVLVFFLLAATLLCLLLIERPTFGRAALLGAAFGLALATKVSAAPLALAIVGAHLLAVWKRAPEGRLSPVERLLGGLIVTFGTAAFFFVVTQPFALLDRETFLANITEQSEMVRRIRDYPYTRQYIDTPKYWYHIHQLSLFGLGLPFGIAGWLGFLWAVGRAAVLRQRGEIVLLLWAVPYFAINGAFEVKFLRYLLPLIPFLALFAARFLLDLTSAFARLSPRGRAAGGALMSGVVGATALWGLAYVQIYARPHPATAMAAWMTANVPAGATIAKEHWEEGLPNLGMYRIVELNLYDPDDPAKLRAMATALATADYLLFYSNRLYGTIPRLPERYPMTTEYYRRLFGGELGFTLVHAEARYPSLAGIALMENPFVRPGLPVPAGLERFLPSPRLDLGFADESYSVYDHPLVLLFRRTEPLTAAQIEQQLAPFLPAGPTPPAGTARPATGLMLPPSLAAAQWAGGTWRAIFPDEGVAARVPLLLWLVAIEAIGLLALPLAMVAGRALPDRGVLLAKPLGLLLVAWLPFLGASTRIVPFERWSILLAAAVIAAGSAAVLWRGGHRLLADLRGRQRMILAGQAVFLAAFLAFVWIRALNPDLWHPARGGEKPMDLAYLTAVVRSTYFPAYDPWFAGGYLNYYYFGQVIVATVIKLTGIVPEIAYNLAVATLFAFAATLAFSVVLALTRVGRTDRRGEGAAIAGGVIAAIFVCVAGNLDGLAQLLDGLRAAGAAAVRTQLPFLSGAAQAWSGLLRIAAGEATMPAFDFWRSSRMMPPQISITEFPYFTFLFADLHAHLIALPFTLLVISLALNIALGGRGIVPLLFVGLATGMLRAANTWDYPTYTVLAIAAVGIGTLPLGLQRRRSGVVARTLASLRLPLPSHPFAAWGWGVAWRAAVILAVGYLAFLPFHQHYELFYSGVELSKETTPLHQYLAVHGLFLFLGVSWLAYESARCARGTGLDRLAAIVARHWDRLPHVLSLAARFGRAPVGAAVMGLGAVAFVAALLALLGLPTPALIVLLVVPALLLALRRTLRPDHDTRRDLAVLALLVLGLALGALVDIVTVRGDIARMNTVFKFYLQAWVLLAVAAAYAFWRLVLDGPLAVGTASRAAMAGRAVWTTALALLLAGALIYPVAATPARLRDRFLPLPPTLDGTAYMAHAVYQDERGPIELRHDLDAIRWLRDNLDGTPIIVEGVTPFYRWGSRVTVYTGLPTVIGWDWHQKQQRWGYQHLVDQRIADVTAFYTGTDPNAAAAFLARYGVRYVIVGTVERNYYPPAGLAKFDQMTDRLEAVYRNAGTTIYRVKL
ncbi:MAG: DUF2298 domain-containing protein [Chloroflexota bacterium]|nr:DUF2298 domain-containing protein [Dehalococcoidia bacterium]MDW8253617.1 DUF2298 domain-containing protein [Chloroflexota bacterium]